MKRVAVIVLVSYLAFALEFLLFNFFAPLGLFWQHMGKPELLILVVIFFNLYLGIRFSIIAAIFCGILKDTLGLSPPGTHVLVFLAASYLTTFVRRYLYQPGSKFSRLVVVFCVVVGTFAVQAILINMNHEVRLGESLEQVLIPQLITTMAAATYVFERLRKISHYFRLKT